MIKVSVTLGLGLVSLAQICIADLGRLEGEMVRWMKRLHSIDREHYLHSCIVLNCLFHNMPTYRPSSTVRCHITKDVFHVVVHKHRIDAAVEGAFRHVISAVHDLALQYSTRLDVKVDCEISLNAYCYTTENMTTSSRLMTTQMIDRQA